MKHFILSLCVFGSIVACANHQVAELESSEPSAYRLACKEILNAQNEAVSYQKAAARMRGNNTDFLMPLGYISTYMKAEDAKASLNARIDYLDKIATIMSCDAIGQVYPL